MGMSCGSSKSRPRNDRFSHLGGAWYLKSLQKPTRSRDMLASSVSTVALVIPPLEELGTVVLALLNAAAPNALITRLRLPRLVYTSSPSVSKFLYFHL